MLLLLACATEATFDLTDRDDDGYGAAVDCDDTDPEVGLCDSGEDCEDQTWYADADGDGYGDPDSAYEHCSQPGGHVADATDCDDKDPSVHPGAEEVCDDLDNDCDEEIDWGRRVPSDHDTLQAAHDDAESGDTLCVEAGTYTEEMALSKGLVLVATEGPNVTVLDGEDEHRIATIRGSETVRFEGFTFTRGADEEDGGAVWSEAPLELVDVAFVANRVQGPVARGGALFASSSLLVEDSTFSDNAVVGSEQGFGGALHATDHAELRGVTFEGNAAWSIADARGGAVRSDAWLVLEDCILRDNRASALQEGEPYASQATGGAVDASGSLRLTATDLVGNRATASHEERPVAYGGAIQLDATWVEAHQVLFAGNRVEVDEAPYSETLGSAVGLLGSAELGLTNGVLAGNEGAAAVGAKSSLVELTNVDFAANPDGGLGGNAQASLSAVNVQLVDSELVWDGEAELSYTNQWPGDGFDPLYASTEGEVEDWDLSLQEGSPAIDAGDPAILDVDGTTSDLGAYGGPEGSW